MTFYISDTWRIIWDWPTKKMKWFFWGWKPEVMNSRGWRFGPMTLWHWQDGML